MLQVKVTTTDNRDKVAGVSKELLSTGTWGAQEFADMVGEVHQTLVKTSHAILKEEQNTDRFPKNKKSYLTLVDNTKDKPVEMVNPFGIVEFIAKQSATKIVKDCWDTLNKHTIVRSGTLISFNRVYTSRNKSGFYSNWASLVKLLNDIDAGKVQLPISFFFTNVTQYSRRLEYLNASKNKNLGRISKGKRTNSKGKVVEYNLKKLKRSGAFTLTHRYIKAKYGKLTDKSVNLVFRPLDAYGVPAVNGRRTTFMADSRPYVHPILVFTISEKGINL